MTSRDRASLLAALISLLLAACTGFPEPRSGAAAAAHEAISHYGDGDLTPETHLAGGCTASFEAVMSEHPNLARYWRAYQAFTTGDADTIREMLADDLVWHVPGRHRFSGDRNKAETMALFEEVVPEFSETGKPVIKTFNIQVEGVVATDEWVFTRVHWNHSRDGKRFDQHGVEMYRMNAEGQIAEFWALMRDTAAFDEFFA